MLAAIFTLAVCAGGIPALRQDWFWPTSRVNLIATLFDATSGWGWNGFGDPRPYFSGCAFVLIRALAIDVLGPFGGFIAMTFLIGLAVAYAGDAMASLLTSKPLVRASAAAFALFNPWVYAKLVAGHYPMILSYAALALILRETLLQRPRPLRAALIAAIMLPQLQFFLLALPLLLYLAIRRRRYLPLITALVVSLPIWIGVLFESRYLAGIPYTLEWQSVQSVPPRDALLLLGYFPGYLRAIDWVALPMMAILLLAAIGTELRASTNRWISWWAVVVALFLFAAMGTRSWLAPVMASVFVGQHISALFRELYDLLGLVAIGYGFYAVATAERWRAAAVVFAVACIALIVSWKVVPPFHYWVDARTIPSIAVQVSPNYRTALSPAIQPLSFEGFGSGADPDTSAVLGSDANVLNEYLPSYPVNAAFGRFLTDGDTSGLAVLSVNAIVYRPWLRAGAKVLDPRTNADALAVAPSNERARVVPVKNPIPIFSLSDLPGEGSLNRGIGAGGIFFGDAGERVHSIVAPALTPDPARGWASVDLVALRYPEIAQGIGGAATTSSLPLVVQSEAWALVYVRGRLSFGSTAVGSARGQFEWVATPPGPQTFTCTGLCAVIATTAARPRWPLEPAGARTYVPLDYAALTPWLLHVSVPAIARPQLLRFNTRFNPHWIASGAGAPLRIDAAVNGWPLSASATPRQVVLVHTVAATQFVFAVLGLLWTLVLVGLWLREVIERRLPRRARLQLQRQDEASVGTPPTAGRR